MAEQNDMDTIAALLGNLIDRIDKMESQQAANTKALANMQDYTKVRDEELGKLLNAIVRDYGRITEKIGQLSVAYDAGQRSQASESASAKRHGEINEWTGDHSRQLSEMRVVLDRVINKKKGIFS